MNNPVRFIDPSGMVAMLPGNVGAAGLNPSANAIRNAINQTQAAAAAAKNAAIAAAAAVAATRAANQASSSTTSGANSNAMAGATTVPVPVPWDKMLPLAGILPFISSAVAAKAVAVKAAAATFWIPVVGKIVVAGAVTAAGEIINQTAQHSVDATAARNWALAQVKAGGVDPGNLRRHSVYVLFDNRRNEVFYVGRTQHFHTRRNAHNRDPRFADMNFKMIPVYTNMDADLARVLEQALISAFTLDALANMINSIAPHKWGEFNAQFQRMQKLLSGH